MQAYAEGFDLFDKSEYELDNAKIAHLWMQGSVVRSWLCELAARAFEQEGNDLAGARAGYTADSGEGRWTIEDAIEHGRADAGRSPPRCTRASTRAATATSPHACSRRCATSSAATRCSKRADGVTRRAPRENPLVEGLERLPVHPTTLVDLRRHRRPGQRKLLPALYNLAHEGALPERFNLDRRLAQRHAARGLPRTSAREAIRSSRAARPTRPCSTALLGERPLRPRHVRRRRRLRAARQRRSTSSTTSADGQPLNRAFYLSTAPEFFPVIVERARRAGLDRRRRRRGARDHREAVRHDAAPRRASSTASVLVGLRRAARSSASTTTWARRRSRTCWRSASPTACSSRCGTATTSTTCRSPRPRTSASARAPATTTTPARCATSSRTTCSSCCCLLCMEPPVDFAADEVRDEKVKVLHAIRAADAGRRRRRWPCARSTPPGTVGGEDVPGYLEEEGVPADSQHRDLRGAAPGGRQLALGRRAVLPAHRQAAGAQGHRDRGHAASRSPTSPSSRTARSACGPTSSSSRMQPNEGVSLSLGAKIPARGCASAR